MIKKKILNVYDLLLCITYFLLILDPAFSVGVDPIDISKVYILGIPASDLALFLMLITFLSNLNTITKFVSKRILLLGVILIIYFLLQGMIINGISNISIYNLDIRIFLWFFGGIAFANVLINTGRIIQYMKVILVVSTALIVISSIYSTGYSEYVNGLADENERIGHPNIYILGAWIFSPTVLLFNITPPKLFNKVVPLVSTFFYLYFVAVLSGTRSSAITCFAILVLFAISLKIKSYNSTISIEKLKQRSKIYILITFVFILVYSAFYLDAYRITRMLTIFDSKSIAGDPRAFELLSFFVQSNFQQLIIGRGLGGSISSPIYNGEFTSTLHIGIMNFWMKLGFVPFLMVVYFLFIRVPIKYIKSYIVIKRKITNNYHTANVIVLSTLFPWLISLLISGGFGEINFLFSGFTLYTYGMVKTNGINSIAND
jgi:hypothetical protein